MIRRNVSLNKVTKEERAVFRAALSCVNKNGYAFLFARQDVNLYVIDRAKFQRLEAAVARYRQAKKEREAR